MRKLILAARSGLLRSALVATPLVIASACSESGGNFFTPTTGGTGGATSGGTGGVGTGGTAGKGSGGTANATNGGTGAMGGSGGMTMGGTAGTGGVGSGGDAPIAGTGGTDATGGTAGSDGGGGEGGTGNEGGMDPTAGTAGSMGGDAGSSTVAGSSGSGGDAGTGGVAGAGGGAGAGMGGMAGTGGTGCVPKTEVCDGEDNDCGDDSDEGDVCPPGCHGATFGGRSFLLCTVNNGADWNDALDICQGLATESAPVAVAGPMTLVQVDSAEENAFLIDWIVALNLDVNVWLGANDVNAEGRWFWDRGAGTPVAFLTVINNNRTIIDGRYNDFPNGTFMPASGDCAHFDPAEDFRWNDRSCTVEGEAFICGEIR